MYDISKVREKNRAELHSPDILPEMSSPPVFNATPKKAKEQDKVVVDGFSTHKQAGLKQFQVISLVTSAKKLWREGYSNLPANHVEGALGNLMRRRDVRLLNAFDSAASPQGKKKGKSSFMLVLATTAALWKNAHKARPMQTANERKRRRRTRRKKKKRGGPGSFFAWGMLTACPRRCRPWRKGEARSVPVHWEKCGGSDAIFIEPIDSAAYLFTAAAAKSGPMERTTF